MTFTNATPITEQSNSLTTSIDLSQHIFLLLKHSDSQLFSSYQEYDSIYRFCAEIRELGQMMRSKSVAMSGCGTSGRIAWMCARAWHKYMRENGTDQLRVQYMIAGGDSALIRSEEVAEDNVNQEIPEDIDVLVGISCGLSAPYVAAQLKNMIETHRRGIMLGFNPVQLARDREIFSERHQSSGEVPIKSFKDLLNVGRETNTLTLINPTLGPEPITGSTRMKGGSATKFLLDAAFIHSQTEQDVFEILHQYETTYRYAYDYNGAENSKKMEQLIEVCGKSLLSKGHIYYVGHDAAGILALVDASECVPTYGANFEDIRGFIMDGWQIMGNNEGDIESHGDAFKISTSHFAEHIVPQLTTNDTVVFLYIDAYGEETRNKVRSHYEALLDKISSGANKPHLAQLLVGELNSNILSECLLEACQSHQITVQVPLLSPPKMPGFATYGELAMKFLLNAVSTGAHIHKGTVYQNQMINLRVSNNKLFYRAVQIVARVAGVSETKARENLLQSIYNRDSSAQAIHDSDDNDVIESHIRAAVRQTHVVPVAILLARGDAMQEAMQLIKKYPRIRQVMEMHARS